ARYRIAGRPALGAIACPAPSRVFGRMKRTGATAPRGTPAAKSALIELGPPITAALRRRFAPRPPSIGRNRGTASPPVRCATSTARFENPALTMIGVARRKRLCAFGTVIAGFSPPHLQPDIGEIRMRRSCPRILDELHSPALLARFRMKP